LRTIRGADELGLSRLLKSASDQFVDLISRMLVLNPSKRIKSKEILEHPYFKDVSAIVPPFTYQRFIMDRQKRRQAGGIDHMGTHDNNTSQQGNNKNQENSIEGTVLKNATSELQTLRSSQQEKETKR